MIIHCEQDSHIHYTETYQISLYLFDIELFPTALTSIHNFNFNSVQRALVLEDYARVYCLVTTQSRTAVA